MSKRRRNPQNKGKGWFNHKPQHILASKGIPTKTTYTRKYAGIEVKDYGFMNAVEKLRNKYPELRIKDDTPLKATRDTNLGVQHTVTIKLPIKKYSSDFEEVELLTIYDKMDDEWNFYEDNGEYKVDIFKLLDSIKEEYL